MSSLSQDSPAPARAVLLGASNVARCLPTALVQARAALASAHPDLDAEIYVAAGRGRSYNNTSELLGRWLPGILPCGLWDALDSTSSDAVDAQPPTYALITDIGNDLVYGVDVDRIFQWIREVVERFQAMDARISVTMMALENLDRFPHLFLEGFCKVLYPSSNIRVPEMLDRADRLDELLRRYCEEQGLPVVEQSPDDFGLDPIHYRLKHRHRIWRGFVAPWLDKNPEARHILDQSAEPLRPLYAGAWPERFGWGRRELERLQPCLHLPDGTPVSLY